MSISWPKRVPKGASADLDYPHLLALAQTEEPGLILFRDGNWREDEVVSRLRDLLNVLSPADLERSIVTVDKKRVRRRRLPVCKTD